MIHTHKDVKYPKLNSQVIHKVKIPSIVQIFTILISLDTIIANCPPISRYHPSFNENIYTGRAIFVEHNLPRVTTVPVKNEEAESHPNDYPSSLPSSYNSNSISLSSVYISLLSPPFTLHFSSLTPTILPPPPKNQYGVASVYDVVAATACRLSPFLLTLSFLLYFPP